MLGRQLLKLAVASATVVLLGAPAASAGVPNPLTDLDGDGGVSIGDVIAAFRCIGQDPASPAQPICAGADVDQDGDIDMDDFNDVRANIGQTFATGDTVPPVVDITSPVDGATVSETTIALSATVDDPVATIELTVQNGDGSTTLAGFNGAGLVSVANVPLAPGANDLTLTATDTDGNAGSTSITVFRPVPDTTPPTVAIDAPADGSTTGDETVTVSGTAADETALAGVTVNGVAASLSGDTFAATVALAEGPNTLTAVARDAAGNTASTSIQVTRVSGDVTPPLVTITAPADLALLGEAAVTVAGEVDDPTAAVTVAGQAATVTPGTPTTFEATVALREGRNVLTVVATDPAGNAASANVQVTVDTEPPTARIETPRDGAVLTSRQVDVAGLVNDIVTGTTINADDCRVVVNGVEARVQNRAFVVPELLLQRGHNVITVEATDRAGNTATSSVTVDVQDQAGQRVVLLGGNNQEATAGSVLPDPLVVSLLDGNGNPVPNQVVNFEVVRGGGQVSAFPLAGSTIAVRTNDNGIAGVSFDLGARSGAGNHRVRATAPGFIGEVEFCASATVGTPELITPVSGDMQTGAAEQPLPLPFVVLANDGGGNPLGGVDVQFEVVDGGGSIEGATTVVRTTDNDGLTGVTLTLGPQEGSNNNLVQASVVGAADIEPAVFTASSRVPGAAADTTISGVVLDTQENPVPGATVHVEVPGVTLDPVPTTVTDDQGLFTLSAAPVGAVHLVVDGSTTSREGDWPTLAFDLVTVAGRDNPLEMPAWLMPLSSNRVVVQDGGPPVDVSLVMPDIPGTELTIHANSVDCPEGQTECEISWTQVRGTRVPMPPPNGSSFMLAWTLQPAGAHFDPPVSICIPNAELAPGEQTEMYSFDHDLGEFVAIGTATITADGSQLCSDPGFGIVKAGWGGCAPPPPPRKCTISCDDRNECTNGTKVDPPCRCDQQKLTGPSCGDQPGANSCRKPGVCQNGVCSGEPKDPGSSCDDGRFCTENDKCEAGGTCKGTDKPDVVLAEQTITLSGLNQAIQRVQTFLNLVQLGRFQIPPFEGEIKFDQKNVCCEEKQGAMTLESSGGGTIKIPFKSIPADGPFTPTIPPWSGNYTVTVFGRSIGVRYGVEIQASVSANFGLSRTKRECQEDTCWSGSAQVGLGANAGIGGQINNPALPNECGFQKNQPCALLKVSGNAGVGVNAQATVGCDKITGALNHDGLKFNAVFTALEGTTFFETNFTYTIPIIQPGPIGPLSISLPL